MNHLAVSSSNRDLLFVGLNAVAIGHHRHDLPAVEEPDHEPRLDIVNDDVHEKDRVA